MVPPVGAAQAPGMDSPNKDLVDTFIQELFTKGDLDAVEHHLHPDYVDHDPPTPGAPTREGMREAAALFRQALPDWHSDLLGLVGEGDTVVERFRASGTHTGGPLMGVPATGRRLVLDGINIFRIEDGRIVERWGRLDELGLLRQLGLVPGE